MSINELLILILLFIDESNFFFAAYVCRLVFGRSGRKKKTFSALFVFILSIPNPV